MLGWGVPLPRLPSAPSPGSVLLGTHNTPGPWGSLGAGGAQHGPAVPQGGSQGGTHLTLS